MKIDNRIFVTPAMPFISIFLARGAWFFAGLEWEPDPFGVSVTILFSLTAGLVLTSILFTEKVSLGYFTIGKPKT